MFSSAVAVVLFCVIQFWAIPAKQAEEAECARDQTDALTHDISVIEDFKTPYIGNAINVSGLFEVLPLNNVAKKYEINSNTCALTVNYLDTIWNIGEEKVHRDLIYNSVAAMMAIDNLTEIAYNFSGDSFSFTRAEIEEVLGTPLSGLLYKDIWEEQVQNQIGSADFIEKFYTQ